MTTFVEQMLRAKVERQARELGQQDAMIAQLRQQLESAKRHLETANEAVRELQTMNERAREVA